MAFSLIPHVCTATSAKPSLSLPPSAVSTLQIYYSHYARSSTGDQIIQITSINSHQMESMTELELEIETEPETVVEMPASKKQPFGTL